MPNIKLQSSDEVIFDVEVKIAKVSSTIKIMLEDCGMENDENTIIPLLNVNSHTLTKILEWAEYHKDEPQFDNGYIKEEGDDEISSWDADFLSPLDKDTIFELMNAANYLDIKPLLDVTTRTVANMLKKNLNPLAVREFFNLSTEFTPRNDWWNY